jgi:hypothetical protein
MMPALRVALIIGGVLILMTLNTLEFKSKRRTLQTEFAAAPTDDPVLALARQQALQTQTLEQLLHMIHTLLAAILAALLWR